MTLCLILVSLWSVAIFMNIKIIQLNNNSTMNKKVLDADYAWPKYNMLDKILILGTLRKSAQLLLNNLNK